MSNRRITAFQGCEYIDSTSAQTSKNYYAIIPQEDTVFTAITGGSASTDDNTINYSTSIGLSGKTLKQGALITAPEGEVFKSLTISSGSYIAYK
jgi:hypothetical protein